MALVSELHVLDPPTKELKYLLELFNQDQVCGTALECALRTLWIKALVYVLQLQEEKMISDEALDSGLLALRSSIEIIDIEKPSKDLDEDVTKDKLYHEPWCMPGFHKRPMNRYPRNQDILKRYPFYRIDGNDVDKSAQSESIAAQI